MKLIFQLSPYFLIIVREMEAVVLACMAKYHACIHLTPGMKTATRMSQYIQNGWIPPYIYIIVKEMEAVVLALYPTVWTICI